MIDITSSSQRRSSRIPGNFRFVNVAMDALEVSEDCIICKQPLEGTSTTATLGEKGSASINKANYSRNDTIHSLAGQQVHQECRRKYCNPQQIARVAKLGKQKYGTAVDTARHQLRSAEKQFNFSTDCFFCGTPAKLGRKRRSSNVFPVQTVELRDTILAMFHERGDTWADAVQARLLHIHDLHAADAVYHGGCSVNFRTKKQIPAIYQQEMSSSKRAKLGRPKDKERTDAFLEVASFLEENDDEQITIHDLIGRMEDNLADSEHGAYSYPQMQKKLQEYFGNTIIETEINGKMLEMQF